ncbi:MAG: hypothetical protein H6883_01230 [Rhodobiaceae bacterium]|nr:hypothetical protein [Rhodobiaceae bacterium]MCC0054739.1 hypothetical protein [Rhodobiaceae bacterium]
MAQGGDSAEVIAAPAGRGWLSPQMLTSIARVQGVLMGLILVATILQQFLGFTWLARPAETATVIFLITVAFVGSRTAKVFLIIAVACIPAALLWVDQPWTLLEQGIARAQFFLAFFTAILSLHEPAFNSPMIQDAGRFLARQPPARRTLTMLLGGHMFGLMLNLGSMVLLGSLTMSRKAGQEPVKMTEFEVRQSAVASLRGFNTTAMWSPLSLTPLVVMALMPGTDSHILIPVGLACAMVTITIAYFVSRYESARLGHPQGTYVPLSSPIKMIGPVPVALLRIVLLVGCMFAAILAVSRLTGFSISVTVTLVIPIFALGWMLVLAKGNMRKWIGGHVANLVLRVWPAQSPEVTLMAAAGFASPVIAAVIPSAQILALLKAWHVPPAIVALMGFVCVLGGGYLGVNPLIAISVVIGTVSDPASLGLNINYFAIVLIVAWAFTAQLSPFTASALLCARLFNTNSFKLAFEWQRLYALVAVSIALVATLIAGWLI